MKDLTQDQITLLSSHLVVNIFQEQQHTSESSFLSHRIVCIWCRERGVFETVCWITTQLESRAQRKVGS
jgi:hypothetical protein